MNRSVAVNWRVCGRDGNGRAAVLVCARGVMMHDTTCCNLMRPGSDAPLIH